MSDYQLLIVNDCFIIFCNLQILQGVVLRPNVFNNFQIHELQRILSNNNLELHKNELKEKNKLLEAQVENAKKELIRLELANGRKQVCVICKKIKDNNQSCSVYLK